MKWVYCNLLFLLILLSCREQLLYFSILKLIYLIIRKPNRHLKAPVYFWDGLCLIEVRRLKAFPIHGSVFIIIVLLYRDFGLKWKACSVHPGQEFCLFVTNNFHQPKMALKSTLFTNFACFQLCWEKSMAI